MLSCGIQLHQIRCYLVYRCLNPALCLIPFGAPELIKLRCRTLAGAVFLYGIKVRSRDIQVSSVPVLYFHIVLGDVSDRHLLYSLINTESVTFMYHIVAYIQLGVILYPLSTLIFDAFLFLLLRRENITLGYDHELDQGIFEPAMYPPVAYHHLTRLYYTVEILCIVCGYTFIATFGTASFTV